MIQHPATALISASEAAHEDGSSAQRILDWLTVRRDRLILWLVLAGVICRLVQYLWRISFWHDESFLVHNVLERSTGGLVGSLELHQTAPPAFLVLTDWIVQIAGTSELAFRLIPVVSSVLALVLFALLARQLLSAGAALLATAMFAFGGTLLIHAAEFKQYSSDSLVATLLLAIWLWPAALGRWARLAMLAISTSILLWFSTASALAFAGIALSYWGEARLDFRRVMSWGMLCAIPACAFAALYWFSLRYQQNPFLYQYWDDGLLEASEWRSWPLWSIGRLYDAANYAGKPMGVVILAAAAIATWSLWRGGRRVLALALSLPIVVCLLAATAGRYPMDGRTTLFLTPMYLLLCGQGLSDIYGWLQGRPRWRNLLAVVPLAIVTLSASVAAYHLVVPRCRQHIRPAAEFLAEHWNGSDPIYVLGNSYYPLSAYWRGDPARLIPREYDISAPTDSQYWLVFGFNPDKGLRAEQGILNAANETAQVDNSFIGWGGAAIRYTRQGVMDAAQDGEK